MKTKNKNFKYFTYVQVSELNEKVNFFFLLFQMHQ